ncbi:phage/plasmid primase, P4 family [Deinococcus humi]|uniref:P4 family phage/plasmid primase-like protein n=1 Tax=Deinococcus humi TaxID=662880 RepID=A0A7W8JYY5_9DEIO|nr:phage/plasmid primase, P4 family [Deinococcus humi]MBB5365749.1 P4 family phage/plasmid primase-like protein [Deinococcus humi]GGO38359.1 hypothetical protein GCM10008949_44750 [Deinococcus humi]
MPFSSLSSHLGAIQLDDVQGWQKRGFNVYYGISLRIAMGRSGDAGVHPTPLLWMDLDLKIAPTYLPKGSKVEEMTPDALHVAKVQLYSEVMRRCEVLQLPPVAVVNSGHGLQILWRRKDCTSTAETEALNHTLYEHFKDLGADRSTKNAERILRLPGSLNLKNPQRPLPVGIWHLNPNQDITRSALMALTPAAVQASVQPVLAAPSVTVNSMSTGDTAGAQRAAKRRRAEVTAAVRSEAEKVATAPSGQRNNCLNVAAMKLARFLPHGELSEAELTQTLVKAAQKAGLDDGEILPTIRSGIKKGTQDPADPERFDQEEQEKQEKRLAKPSAKRPAPQQTGPAKGGQHQMPVLPEAAQQGGPMEGGEEGSATAHITLSCCGDLPPAEELPDPEGEGSTYSDAQLLALLGLSWPVTAINSDKAHAHRLHDNARGDLAFVPELGGYVAWNGQQWLSGGKHGAGQVRARQFAQDLGISMKWEIERLLTLYGIADLATKRLAAEHGVDAREVKVMERRADALLKAYNMHIRAAKATEADKRQQAILNSAQTLHVKDVCDFESRPWVIGFPNGTWERGEFRPARRDDHLLTLAAVPYLKDADQSEFKEVLYRITGGDEDFAHTLQDACGYAMSGASSQRVVPWLYGGPGTGKSTVAELIATVLGEKAVTLDPKHLAANASRERLGASIYNKSVVVCAEAGNAGLDAETLKTLSGGDRLSVRMLYAEAFTARPSHALFMVANDPPRVDAYDDALKARVLAMPFCHPLNVGGPLLKGKRLEEVRQDPTSALVQGFVAWAIEGAERVYRTGKIHRAAVCQEATRAFWNDVDPLRDFWPSLTQEELRCGISVSAMRRAYDTWCQESGVKPLGVQKFNRACKSVGLDSYSNGKERGWRLVKPADFPGEVTPDEIELTTLTTLTAPSQNPSLSLSQRGEKAEVSKNGSESVKVVSCPSTGWQGADV